MEQPKVFISYSSADRQDAFRLLKIVEAAGADAWMDFFDIKPASLLDQQLTSNLLATNRNVAVAVAFARFAGVLWPAEPVREERLRGRHPDRHAAQPARHRDQVQPADAAPRAANALYADERSGDRGRSVAGRAR